MEQDLERILKIKEIGYDPYVMVYDKPHAPKEIRHLQRWCNNKWIFRSCDWEDYLKGDTYGNSKERHDQQRSI